MDSTSRTHASSQAAEASRVRYDVGPPATRALGVSPPAILVVGAAVVAGTYVVGWLVAGAPETMGPATANRVALDTGIGMAAGIAALVIAARITQKDHAEDALLIAALMVMASASIVWRLALPEPAMPEYTFASAARLGGALLLLAAAWVPPDMTVRRHAVPRPLGLALIVLAGAAAITLLLLIDVQVRAHPSSRALAWACAAVATATVMVSMRKRRITGDPLWGWIAAACVFFAAARVQVALSPAGEPQFLGGDYLPLCAYLCIVGGAIAEARAYVAARARDEAAHEARAIAREVHEGLLQDIVFARRTAADAIADEMARERTVRALLRAEGHGRSLMGSVTRQYPVDFSARLRDGVVDAGSRLGIEVRARVAEGLSPPPDAAEALIYAATEGVANAARHSGAGTVRIEAFARGGTTVVRIRDTGCGMVTGCVPFGFGLKSSNDLVRACGGALHVSSEPGRGTNLELEA